MGWFAYGAHAPLSPAELSAAVLDGELVRISRTAYGVVFRPDSAFVRAGAAQTILPPGYAAVRTTAAWIHGALDAEPDPHHAQLLEGAPARRHWTAGLVAHSRRLPLADVVVLGGVPTSSLERTCYDVARDAITGPHHDANQRALDWFRSRTDLHPRLIAWLSQGRRLNYTARVRELLTEGGLAPGYEDVTR